MAAYAKRKGDNLSYMRSPTKDAQIHHPVDGSLKWLGTKEPSNANQTDKGHWFPANAGCSLQCFCISGFHTAHTVLAGCSPTVIIGAYIRTTELGYTQACWQASKTCTNMSELSRDTSQPPNLKYLASPMPTASCQCTGKRLAHVQSQLRCYN